MELKKNAFEVKDHRTIKIELVMFYFYIIIKGCCYKSFCFVP